MVDILNRIVYNYNCKNKPTGRKEERMFDKEISHYNVIISDFVSSAGKFIRLKSVNVTRKTRRSGWREILQEILRVKLLNSKLELSKSATLWAGGKINPERKNDQ